ncbi:MAG: hypothetical protein CSB19_02135 [Clostridiales bacterium]|nr:MAG: hypothetical protein CSB19_02135 [Clostridiales bacterium]
MELTLKEMQILANYLKGNDYSIFADLPKIKGEGTIESLQSKGVLEGDQLTKGARNLFETLANPEIVAKFHLNQLEVNMRKRTYRCGTQSVLVEFHREMVILSPFDTEVESVRVEIANHTGVSFQKHSQLKQVLSGDELLTLMGLADWLRRVALSELINQAAPKKLEIKDLEAFMEQPLKLGLLAQTIDMTHLKAPRGEALQKALSGLLEKRLVEAYQPQIVIDKSTILLAINFLVPNMTTSLELYDLTDPKRVLTAREMIVQASPKDALSYSASTAGFAVESLTGGQVTERILAYLSCPSLNTKLQN